MDTESKEKSGENKEVNVIMKDFHHMKVKTGNIEMDESFSDVNRRIIRWLKENNYYLLDIVVKEITYRNKFSTTRRVYACKDKLVIDDCNQCDFYRNHPFGSFWCNTCFKCFNKR